MGTVDARSVSSGIRPEWVKCGLNERLIKPCAPDVVARKTRKWTMAMLDVSIAD